LAGLLASVAVPLAAQQPAKLPTAADVRALLHNHFDVAGWFEFAGPSDRTWAAFSFTMFDLGGSPQPEIVIHMGRGNWCGANGPCHVLAFTTTACGYQAIGEFRMNVPVYALASRTNGWRDVVGMRDGDLTTPAQLVVLPFDGAEYASDLWNQSIRKLDNAPSDATPLLIEGYDHKLVLPGQGALNRRGEKAHGCPVS
jgi:hypothetical protein